MMRFPGLLLRLCVIGCVIGGTIGCAGSPQNNNHDAGPVAIDGLQRIEIAPASASLTVTDASAPTQQFTATGHFADGHTADVTQQLQWTLSDATLGGIGGGLFTSSPQRGGRALVQATDGVQLGNAQLAFKLSTVHFSTNDGSTAGPDAATRFAGGTTDPALAPALAYPLDGAMVPRNLGELEVQWRRPSSAADLFEVSFESELLDFKVYTNGSVPAGGRLQLKPAEWTSVAETAAGSVVTIQVRAVQSANPGKLGASATAQLTIGSDPVLGGVYYFTPDLVTDTGKIFRHAFGDTSGEATQFFPTGSEQRCVGCHVLSRDGQKFAVSYNGAAGAYFGVSDLQPILPESKGVFWNFSTLSPDGKRVAATELGRLDVYDLSGGASTGMKLATLEPGGFATHPDWSPDGKSIVYVRIGQQLGSLESHFYQGSLVIVDDDGMGGFGPPRVLVQSAGENNYYPSFSPDGHWILFNRSTRAGGADDGDSYDDPSATLYVVSVDGAVGPVRLAGANGTAALTTNSWPRWSPFVQHNGESGDLLYFTFSSKRDYGIELVGTGAPQIWMAAFNPLAPAENSATSPAAFWLPFQDVKSHNHIAQWTTEIVAIQ
jgi:hypothetical protein